MSRTRVIEAGVVCRHPCEPPCVCTLPIYVTMLCHAFAAPRPHAVPMFPAVPSASCEALQRDDVGGEGSLGAGGGTEGGKGPHGASHTPAHGQAGPSEEGGAGAGLQAWGTQEHNRGGCMGCGGAVRCCGVVLACMFGNDPLWMSVDLPHQQRRSHADPPSPRTCFRSSCWTCMTRELAALPSLAPPVATMERRRRTAMGTWRQWSCLTATLCW